MLSNPNIIKDVPFVGKVCFHVGSALLKRKKQSTGQRYRTAPLTYSLGVALALTVIALCIFSLPHYCRVVWRKRLRPRTQVTNWYSQMQTDYSHLIRIRIVYCVSDFA